jgi:succinate dehydrogenase / fumarate reductase, cytochrome b subunit
MAAAVTLYRSTIGKKVIMALSGFILVGFVIVHLAGNLKAYTGAEHFNEYGHFLREVGAPVLPQESLLWVVRLVLLAAVGLHIWAATSLTIQDRASRPQRYAYHRKQQATYASLTMRWGGVIILLFIVYHILHFTVGTVHPDFIPGDAYHNFVVGFRVWYVSLFYILAMIALGFHLYHGVWSMFQTMGWNNRVWNGVLRGVAIAVALVIALGNISLPIAVMAGIIS